MDPIDNVSRDSKDGSYRCPQCQTPFTRRSNLRRHFQIHLRGISLICEVCNEEHSTKDSLQDHVANSHWHSPTVTWDVSHEKPLQRFVIPQDIASHSPFATMFPPSYGPFSSQSTSISQNPNLVSSAPSHAFQVPNFGRLNFSTSGSSSSALSSDAILQRSTSSLTSDTSIRTPIVGFPPISNTFSHRRSSTSISPESSIAPSSPYTRIDQPGPQQGHYVLYPSSEAPPSSTHQDWIAKIMEQQQGLDSDEWPIYTRRDVKKMLDAVSDCFIESVERVLIANGQRPSNPARLNNYSTTLDTRVRQMILTEAIPQLISKLQENDDVNSHAGGGC